MNQEKNPGAQASATGDTPPQESYKRVSNDVTAIKTFSSTSGLSEPHLQTVLQMLIECLKLPSNEKWISFARLARGHLGREERISLAWALLRSLDTADAERTVEAAFVPEVGAGPPIPPLFSVEDEAVFWASQASRHELIAYALACLNLMPAKIRSEILQLAGKWDA